MSEYDEDERWDDDGDEGWDDGGERRVAQPPMPRRGRLRWSLGIVAGFAAFGYAAYLLLSAGSAPSSPAAATVSGQGGGAPVASPSPVGQQAAQHTAQAFLSSWQAGDYGAAAKLTDAPGDAGSALAAYRSGLHLSALSIKLNDTDSFGASVFSVSATVGDGKVTGVWHYTSQLQVYLGPAGPVVQWQADVLAPNLAAGMTLSTQTVDPSGGVVTDAKGHDLSQAADPGVQRIASLLAGAADTAQSGGKPGLEVVYTDADGEPDSATQPSLVTAATAENLATTIDPTAESAAVAAVGQQDQSSIVVLQPSTGHILAIANNDGQNDDALTAQIAPGSTMKVVSSAALLNQGMSMNTDVACPSVYTVTGVPFRNSSGESEPAGTPLIEDFAVSCNNAFTTQYQKLADGTLARTARDYFGLGEQWDIGLGEATAYFSIPPAAEDSELASESFGQGVIQTDPLAMASVAATVDTGVFHQPILLPGVHQVTATPLPSSTAKQLRSMMRAVVTYSDGTAHKVGFGPDVYAKTGTADHGAPGTAANSWMIAYDPRKDVAIACVVLNGGFGDEAAGPLVKSVLNAL